MIRVEGSGLAWERPKRSEDGEKILGRGNSKSNGPGDRKELGAVRLGSRSFWGGGALKAKDYWGVFTSTERSCPWWFLSRGRVRSGFPKAPLG